DPRRFDDSLGAHGIWLDGEAERFLLPRIRRLLAAAGAESKDEAPSRYLLDRGRHVCEEPRVAVRDIEHEGPERHATGPFGQRRERDQALRHARGIAVRIA